MKALVEEAQGYEVVLVASNKPHAPALDWARERGLPTWTWDSKGISREVFDQALGDALENHAVGTIALAGFMRILSSGFIARFANRIVNIHPSLLPLYKGLDTHRRAIDAGDEIAGCTVHLVTEELDSGAILARSEVRIEPGESVERLEQRVLAAEHVLYPRALKEFVRR